MEAFKGYGGSFSHVFPTKHAGFSLPRTLPHHSFKGSKFVTKSVKEYVPCSLDVELK